MAEALPPLELDGPWKEVLEHFLGLFLSWRFPNIHADIDWREDYRSLDQELHKLLATDTSNLKRVDRLVEVTRLSGDQALLHVEAQHQKEDHFEQRMDDYHDRIEVSRSQPGLAQAVVSGVLGKPIIVLAAAETFLLGRRDDVARSGPG